MVVKPRDAATVMLLRDDGRGGGLEVLMVRRHAKSRFVPDAYVFPGGRIEEADFVPEIEKRCYGLDYGGAHRALPDIAPVEKSLGAWVAGIRETFEEVGILFAREATGSLLDTGGAPDERFEGYRRDLHADRMGLDEILDREGLRLAVDELHYFAHWITPVTSPIRYDVRFFAARAPRGQTARHDGIELTGHEWVRPADAIERYDRGDFPIILPTWAMLRELSKFRTVDDALGSTFGKTIPAILSRMVVRNGEVVEVMPGDVRGGDRPYRPQEFAEVES